MAGEKDPGLIGTFVIKVLDESGKQVAYTGLSSEQEIELSRLISTCLAAQPHVLVAVIGNKGIGKSLLGKYFRRKGIGSHSPSKIAVIDDDNMAVDFLRFFRRWQPYPCKGVDELAPFLSHCRKKPIRIYIKSNPESRITRADIVLRVTTSGNKRRQRLIKRYGQEKGNAVFDRTDDYRPDINIAFTYEMTAEL